MNLPEKIETRNNPYTYGLRYGFTILGAFAASSIAFSEDFPNNKLVGYSIIVGAAILIVIMVIYDWGKKKTIEISEDGIREVKNGKETFISWKEYHKTYLDATATTKYGITLGTYWRSKVVTDENTIKIDHQDAGFHEKIVRLSEIEMLPYLRERMKRGKRVYFGVVGLSTAHIYFSDGETGRNHIKSISLNDGKLEFKFDDSRSSITALVKDIPNFGVLMQLLAEGHNRTKVEGWKYPPEKFEKSTHNEQDMKVFKQ